MDIITVDKDKCVNCHRCIAVCPVKYCNNGAGEYVTVDNNLCIHCGRCIDACQHEAREFHDDFDRFLSKSHDNLVFIVAPSIVGSWGMDYTKIISYLKTNLKAKAVYDVSFGAELTVMKYLEHIKNNNPKCIIAQPCPVVVKYIEMYKPQLMKYLAPVDSPAMAMARYLREYKHFKGEIAFLGPCIAKTEEFTDKNTKGYINYNITFKKLNDYMEERRVDIRNLIDSKYDSFDAERAVNFSRPGGLKETIMREMDIPLKVRKIEGSIIFEEYFDELLKDLNANKVVPLVVDVLNCEKGCNFGPASLKNHTLDEVDFFINQRIEAQKKIYGTNAKFHKKWDALKKELEGNTFERQYSKRTKDFNPELIKEEELEKIYADMHKEKEQDFKNCAACGYHDCHDMAVAVYGGMNKKENCVYYMNDLLHTRSDKLQGISSKVAMTISDINEKIKNVQDIFNEINEGFALTSDTLSGGNDDNANLVQLSQNFAPIVDAITEISDQTHLLSLNASIEAARAGVAGKGFAIVAHEVDKLSSETAEEVEKITPMVKELIDKINHSSQRGLTVLDDLASMKNRYDEFSSTMNVLGKIIEELADESIELGMLEEQTM